MTETQKKMVVIVVGLALIVPVVALRIRAALRETAYGPERTEWNPEDLTVLSDSRGPDGFRPKKVTRFDTLDGLAFRKLGTARLMGLEAHLRAVSATETRHFTAIMDAAAEMGANGFTVDDIDPEAPGLHPEWALLTDTLYLIHAGELPSAVRERTGKMACLIIEVFDGTPAARGGLRPGDVVLDIDHKGLKLRAESWDAEPCLSIVRESHVPPIGSEVVFSVARKAELVEVPLLHEGAKYGFAYKDVPVLEDP